MSVDQEIIDAVADILAPHGEHQWGACAPEVADLCDDCLMDSAMAVATAAERERLKAKVLAWAECLLIGQRKELAALFEEEKS